MLQFPCVAGTTLFTYRLAVNPKILNLVQRNGLVLRGPILYGLVTFWVGAEGAQVDLARGDRSDRVDHDGNERVLQTSKNKLLLPRSQIFGHMLRNCS